MNGYTKLFRTIINSTIWRETAETKVVWITMLAMKARDGNVSASLPGLAHIAGVTLEQCKMALERFMAPDPYSSTKTNEGRRVKEIEGGWFILNHFKYLEAISLEDRRAYWATKKRESRLRKRVVSRKLRKR